MNPVFDKFGEKNYHGLLTFKNRNGFTITTVNLNLLHDAISRRSWIETRDFYKQNGRIRHERINIEVGHLLNIQVHSYQSKEINERTQTEESVGGLEHFDIYIFRNPILKGESFTEIHLGDLYTANEKKEFMGYNELSREIFLNNFFNSNECKGDIRDQALAIEFLYSCSKGIHNYYSNKHKIDSIQIRNKHTYPLKVQELKKYSKFYDRKLEKEVVNHFNYYFDIYQLDVIENFISAKGYYEVYLVIDDSKNIASCLLNKTFKNKISANLYFKYLSLIIKLRDINSLSKKIKNSLN